MCVSIHGQVNETKPRERIRKGSFKMKKIVSIILALAMCLTMCAFAFADEYPQPEGGKKFDTNWAIYGMTVRINYEEEGYRVYIRSTDPEEFNGSEWEYSCVYNEEKDALLSISSSKNAYTMDSTGGIERGEYEYQGLDDEGQTTVFAIDEDGFLTWEDGRGQDGADLVFSDIGAFEGFWRSEDGETFADISWNDSEIGDEYGYNVYLHDEGDESYADYSAHGLYDAKTGKLTVTAGSVMIFRLNAEGRYDMEEVPAEEPIELIMSFNLRSELAFNE